MSNVLDGLETKNYSLTVSGEGKLSINTLNQEGVSISTDGTFVMEGGNVLNLHTFKNTFGVRVADFQMNGGSLKVTKDLCILGDARIEGGEILVYGIEEGSPDARIFYFAIL